MTMDELRQLNELRSVLSNTFDDIIAKLIDKHYVQMRELETLKMQNGKMHDALQDIAMTPLLYKSEVELFDKLCDMRKRAGSVLPRVEGDGK